MMEPMTLGSPNNSPSINNAGNAFLPSFLMGNEQNISTPRNNTLSPAKSRSMAFNAQSPGGGLSSSPEFSRSSMQQRFLLNYQQTPTQNVNPHNTSVSGPPTQGLYESFRNEKQSLQTPNRNCMVNQQYNQQMGTPTTTSMIMNQSYGNFNQSNNDSIANQSGFNLSRIMSPIPNLMSSDDIRSNCYVKSPVAPTMSNQPHVTLSQYNSNLFWITVFGFPQTATTTILSHFSTVGTIIDKVLPLGCSNWMHLKFSSRLECDKALNYNGKVIGNNLMVGVSYCTDSEIIDKENLNSTRDVTINKIRPLSQVAYKSAQSSSDVAPSLSVPKRSSGIVNKAMDLFFGW